MWSDRYTGVFTLLSATPMRLWHYINLNIGGTTNWSMYETCNFLRRISSHSPFCDMSDIRCVANVNVPGAVFFRRFFTATWWGTMASKIGDGELNLRIKLHISYIEQSVVPLIFKYLIGAKKYGDSTNARVPIISRGCGWTPVYVVKTPVYPSLPIYKRHKIMRSFTSRSPIFNSTLITCVAAENVPKNTVFHTTSIATQSAFIALKIGKREENLRMILHKFSIHHLILRSFADNLIAGTFLCFCRANTC